MQELCMGDGMAALLEGLLIFGAAVGIGYWELHSLRRARLAREKAEALEAVRDLAATGHAEGQHGAHNGLSQPRE
jgi:hypothetical protein